MDRGAGGVRDVMFATFPGVLPQFFIPQALAQSAALRGGLSITLNCIVSRLVEQGSNCSPFETTRGVSHGGEGVG